MGYPPLRPPPPCPPRPRRADEHFQARTFDARCSYCGCVTRILHRGEQCPNCGARDWSAAVLTRAAVVFPPAVVHK